MSGTNWLRVGAVCGALSVIIGAFGAHGLKEHMSARSLEVYETGAKYQMYHALALLAVGLLALQGRSGTMLNLAGWSFVVGILLFSGSLYALALTGITKLGAITPFGGIGLIIGWFALAIAAGSSGRTTGVEP
jgi:uncharacterized membrane protein YgdD (TMEM256/DUF423 family)